MWKKILTQWLFLGVLKFCFASIDLNTSDIKELEVLKGIGPVKAKSIVRYREQHGDFTSIEQIMKVPGIGTKIYAKIKDQLVLSTKAKENGEKPKQLPGQVKEKKIKYIYLNGIDSDHQAKDWIDFSNLKNKCVHGK